MGYQFGLSIDHREEDPKELFNSFCNLFQLEPGSDLRISFLSGFHNATLAGWRSGTSSGS